MAHDDSTRAAVMAALLTGQSVTAVAKEYSLPSSTVSRWKRDVASEIERPAIGELLEEFLVATLETVTAQVRAFRDPAWLREQDASEVGVLLGIEVDKVVRLLEALEGGPVTPSRNGNGTR